MKSTAKIFICTVLMTASCLCSAQSTKIDSLKRMIDVAKIDTIKVNLYNKLADQYKEINPDSTYFYANKAFLKSQKIQFNFGIANAEINKGNTNIIKGNYPLALTHFSNAQKQYELMLEENPKDKMLQNGLARAYASAGVVYSEQSNYHMALENYRKALKLYQDNDQKANISKALNNIGIVYKAQQNNLKALEYLKKAFKIQEEIGEQNAAVTLTNIGVIYFEAGNKPMAFRYYKMAEKRFAAMDNKRGFALFNNYLGDYYAQQNNISEAAARYQKSLGLYEELQNKFGASLALYNIAKLHLRQKEYQQATEIALKSLDYAKSIGVLDQIYHSEKLLSELYEMQNQAAKSLIHYKNYVAARDSISNQENIKKFAVAEMDFEYKKKEALLAERAKRQTQFTIFAVLGALLIIVLILVLYNRLQVKRRLTLQKEVAEYEQKALHLQMNPHFVFNCLSSISSFIVQNGTDSALKYLSKFSKLMRLTLEYSKGSLIPIDKEIESLQNYLELEQLRFHNKFKFTIHSSDSVEFNMGLPPLLIQPFVENAILHGIVPKESEGNIAVNFDVSNGQLICTITDDGIGLDESKNLKENSVMAHKSMALEITKKRLEIMESTTLKSAQIDIAPLEHKSGTRVTLRLPIQYIQ